MRKRPNKNSKTGLVGISPFRDKYRVEVNKKYIGLFTSKKKAIKARNLAR